jgi:hypothetical protein
MRIRHRLAVRPSNVTRTALRECGVSPKNEDAIAIVASVDESHRGWERLKELLSGHIISDTVTTVFTDSEQASAEWLVLRADKVWGYPQPEETYEEECYSQKDWCEMCGIGLTQVAPLRLLKAPPWATGGLVRVNWLEEDIFVKMPDVGDVLEAQGARLREVLKQRDRTPLESIRQMEVEAMARVRSDGHDASQCARCHRLKIRPVDRGMFPEVSIPGGTRVARTVEWFGHGRIAFRPILIHADVRRALAAANVHGWNTVPCVAALAEGSVVSSVVLSE